MSKRPMVGFNENSEVLLRQVHPSFIQEGRITSQAFRPTPKDEKKLSVNRGSMITPEQSYHLHTQKKMLQSAGVWGVSVVEVKEISGLTIEDNPIQGPPEDPSHCLIDFSHVDSESKVKAIGSKLAEKARARACLFAPSGALVG